MKPGNKVGAEMSSSIYHEKQVCKSSLLCLEIDVEIESGMIYIFRLGSCVPSMHSITFSNNKVRLQKKNLMKSVDLSLPIPG